MFSQKNKMKRILVIGNSGSGKSTFARKLHRATGLPLFHLDLLWHLPDKTNISREEFDTRLEEILALKEWIIDGNYQRTLQQRIAACDTIFLLDYPVEVCLAGVAERIGKDRPDIPWQETEFDPEFRQWILDFPNTQLPDIYRLLDQYRDQKQIIIFTSREEADAWEKHYLR
ncbi:adenylate kinase [Angelakisella massiliensis]|uniref:adenylate kinase n=1 Tax=Angelakisella massiliensis TaxID=1871018 RepID=UPI0023A9112A|nr:adenylate kinase [Angelakisella massiliensis]